MPKLEYVWRSYFLAAKRHLFIPSSFTMRLRQSSYAPAFCTSINKAGNPYHHRCVCWLLCFHPIKTSSLSSSIQVGNPNQLDIMGGNGLPKIFAGHGDMQKSVFLLFSFSVLFFFGKGRGGGGGGGENDSLTEIVILHFCISYHKASHPWFQTYAGQYIVYSPACCETKKLLRHWTLTSHCDVRASLYFTVQHSDSFMVQTFSAPSSFLRNSVLFKSNNAFIHTGSVVSTARHLISLESGNKLPNLWGYYNIR